LGVFGYLEGKSKRNKSTKLGYHEVRRGILLCGRRKGREERKGEGREGKKRVRGRLLMAL
jgi:hypothetical protein